jgi:uncharacterized protein (DUF924 family)
MWITAHHSGSSGAFPASIVCIRLLCCWCYCCSITTISSFAMSATIITPAAQRLKAFVVQPVIQRAIQSPHLVRSVLNFFYGVDTGTEDGREALRRGVDIHAAMTDLWYAGGPDYDDLCRTTFTTTVRTAGRRELQHNEEWSRSVDGKMAQLLLVDQLARNIFRGLDEAFAYEDVALDLARELADINFGRNNNEQQGKIPIQDCPTVVGELYPPYLSSIAVALMHSEQLSDQVTCTNLLLDAQQKHPGMGQLWSEQILFANNHRQVVEQFGRFPHRNVAKRRINTPAETAWLADTDHLPGWAKSQSTTKK